MTIYDFENLLDDIKTILANNLNTKIIAINARKNDSISLETVDSAAYFLQTLDAEVINYNPFIVYAVEEVSSEGQGPYTRDELTISVSLVAADTNIDVNMSKRMFRYLTALKEVLQENWTTNNNNAKLKIKGIPPIDLQLLNTTATYRAVTILIKAVLI